MPRPDFEIKLTFSDPHPHASNVLPVSAKPLPKTALWLAQQRIDFCPHPAQHPFLQRGESILCATTLVPAYFPALARRNSFLCVGGHFPADRSRPSSRASSSTSGRSRLASPASGYNL